MTINGLNAFLKKKEILPKKMLLEKLRGKRVVIDAQQFFYKFKYRASKNLGDVYLMTKDKNIFLDYITEEIVKVNKNFTRNDIDVTFVFDGKAPKEKRETQTKRREIIKEKKKKLKEEFTLENIKKDVSLEEDEMKSIVESLMKLNVKVHIDEFREAECACAKLIKEGKADWVYSEDCDIFAHLCPFIIRSIQGNYITVIALETVLRKLEMDKESFLNFCVMCGTDYNKNLPGLGPGKLFKIMRDEEYEMRKIVKNIKSKGRNFEDLNFTRTRQLFMSEVDKYFIN